MGFKGNKALIKMLSTKSTLTDWLDDLEHDKKEPDKITTEFDLLVLSCCAYRLNIQAKHYTITTSHVVKNVNDFDIALANKIRDYYSKKLMFLKLKGIELTKFRKDLSNFLHGNFHSEDGRYTTLESYIGMASRLPQFYEYDCELEKIFDSDKAKANEKHFRGTVELTFIKKFFVKKKLANNHEFWFVDKNNLKYTMAFNETNILVSFLESYLNNHNVILADGDFFIKYKDNHQYYSSQTATFKEASYG